ATSTRYDWRSKFVNHQGHRVTTTGDAWQRRLQRFVRALGILAGCENKSIKSMSSFSIGCQESFTGLSAMAGDSSEALPFPDDGGGVAAAFAVSKIRLCRQNSASSRRSATPSLSYTLRR